MTRAGKNAEPVVTRNAISPEDLRHVLIFPAALVLSRYVATNLPSGITHSPQQSYLCGRSAQERSPSVATVRAPPFLPAPELEERCSRCALPACRSP
jgi:hypothetical protein